MSNSGDPTPAVSIIPAATEDDPFYRQLRDENERLRQRNDVLTCQLADAEAWIDRIIVEAHEMESEYVPLADAEAWIDRIMMLVMERQGVKGVAG